MRLTNMQTLAVMCILMGLTAGSGLTSEIIYVDPDATGANDGSSWADAYNYLQDALADANSADKPVEIRVAQGIYKPDRGVGTALGDRHATFQLISGVIIKGGFAGVGQPDPNQRNIRVYETILSGDLNANDADVNDPADMISDPNRAENSYSVLTGSWTDATATLDGVTITAGNADGDYLLATGSGAGMFIDHGSPTLKHCTFRLNYAAGGGGMFNWASHTTVINCTFNNNAVVYNGAGMFNMSYSEPTVVNCVFTGNLAGVCGGGMANCCHSATIVANCLFMENMAKLHGGAIRNRDSNPVVTNCTFSKNSAEQYGGGVRCGGSSYTTLTNCILWANTDGSGTDQSGQLHVENSAHASVNYCCIQGWTGVFNGTGNIAADPCFVNPDDGDLHLSADSPCIDKGHNSAVRPGINTDLDNNPRVVDGDCDRLPIVDMGAYEYNWLAFGDFNDDCHVNLIDFSIFADYWGSNDSSVDIAPPGGDSMVDFQDLAIIADHWLE